MNQGTLAGDTWDQKKELEGDLLTKEKERQEVSEGKVRAEYWEARLRLSSEKSMERASQRGREGVQELRHVS